MDLSKQVTSQLYALSGIVTDRGLQTVDKLVFQGVILENDFAKYVAIATSCLRATCHHTAHGQFVAVATHHGIGKCYEFDTCSVAACSSTDSLWPDASNTRHVGQRVEDG